jgi:hypothetical protein
METAVENWPRRYARLFARSGKGREAILNAFRVGSLITVFLRPQREEEVRKHGDLLISGVSPDLCDS